MVARDWSPYSGLRREMPGMPEVSHDSDGAPDLTFTIGATMVGHQGHQGFERDIFNICNTNIVRTENGLQFSSGVFKGFVEE